MTSALNQAIQAVKDQIVNTAATADAEGLAMLGTAIDRIGGRATVIEVVELGDMKKQEITDLAATKTAAFEALDGTKTTAFTTLADTRTADFTALSNTKEADLSALSAAKETSLSNLSDTKEAELTALAATKKTEVIGAGSTWSFTESISSITYDSAGRVSGYVSNQKTVSAITYDSQDRVSGFTEAAPADDGFGGTVTITKTFTVAYDANGRVTSVTSITA